MSIRWAVQDFETLSSTQDHLKEIANDALEGLVIQAVQQDDGRGTHGRNWASPPGNLYLSLLLKPDVPAAQASELSVVMALAVAQSLEYFLDNPGLAKVKWPNDIFIDGKKCAGLLIETELDRDRIKHVVVGIGLNIQKAPLENSAALQNYVSSPLTIQTVRERLLGDIANLYKDWKNHGIHPIKAQWLIRAASQMDKDNLTHAFGD